MNETINERIKTILELVYKGNVTAMAKATYIKRTTINSIVGADEVSPRYEVLKNIAEISSPRISMEWLVRGTGDMVLEDKASDNIASNNKYNKNSNNINGSDTIDRLMSLLEEKDRQISELIKKIK